MFINAQGVPCLANFGLASIARDIYSVNGSNVAGGASVRWSAPELLGPITVSKEASIKPNTRSDIYSLAMVIVEVIPFEIPTGTLPRFTFLLSGLHRENPVPKCHLRVRGDDRDQGRTTAEADRGRKPWARASGLETHGRVLEPEPSKTARCR